ncbi:MAG: hypothetical protein IJA27_08075, partial [Lachnospiraceae bacterium]|nr:hypothetical protein [Lachnospiraceae bacterium]
MKIVLFILVVLGFILSLGVYAIFVADSIKMMKRYKIEIRIMIGFWILILSLFSMNLVFMCASYILNKIYILLVALFEILISTLLIIPLKKMLYDLAEKTNIDEEYEFLVRKSETEQKYYLLMKDYETKLSELRHDFMNQVQVAYGIIENSDNKETGLELLDELSEKIQSTRIQSFCGNPMVNIILSMKQEEFQKYQLSLDTDVILSGNHKMKEMDLCTIIINLLDEMIEIKKIDACNGENEIKGGSLNLRYKNNMISVVTKIYGAIEG